MSPIEKIPPDDPRLTAFALDEMEPAERAEFEKLLKQDAAARTLVTEITGTAQRIGVALDHEPVPTAVPVRLAQAAIIAGRDPRKLDGGPLRSDVSRGMAKLLRFPQLYFTISGLAAACFAVGLLLWETGHEPARQVHYTEVDLTKLVPAEASGFKEAAESEIVNEGGKQTVSVENAGGLVALKDGAKDNSFLAAKSAPTSTFPIKTRTEAYGNVRQLIEHGQRPPPETVRIEEMVNAFAYHYSPPDEGAPDGIARDESAGQTTPEVLPFAAHLEVATAPWAPDHRLVRIGLKGREAQALSGSQEGGPKLIAKGVVIEVEFNPTQVEAYRLIGYENRMLRKADINNGHIDAGEVGAGHTVTALYEVVPTGVEWKSESGADQLKYQATGNPNPASADAGRGPKMAASDDLLMLKLSYQEPNGEASKLLEFPLRETGRTFDQASADFKFAASVAAFGMILRNSPHKGQATYARVSEWALAGLVDDAGGYRAEFVGLVGQAERLVQN